MIFSRAADSPWPEFCLPWVDQARSAGDAELVVVNGEARRARTTLGCGSPAFGGPVTYLVTRGHWVLDALRRTWYGFPDARMPLVM